MFKKITLSLLLIGLAGCASWGGKSEYPEQIGINKYGSADEKPESIFGSNGIVFGNVGEKSDTGLKINAYLWRASLDTISFMPLASADPFGGVIITDWYSPEGVTKERFKLNILILSSALRADGLKVSAFSETMDANGNWQKAQDNTEIARKIESAILTRARELKVSQ